MPDNRGTLADHAVVPPAVPDAPDELLQLTVLTSLDAVPAMLIDAADVDTMVNAGEVIFSEGGAPLGPLGGVGLEGVAP